jgi:hypothetical protein
MTARCDTFQGACTTARDQEASIYLPATESLSGEPATGYLLALSYATRIEISSMDVASRSCQLGLLPRVLDRSTPRTRQVMLPYSTWARIDETGNSLGIPFDRRIRRNSKLLFCDSHLLLICIRLEGEEGGITSDILKRVARDCWEAFRSSIGNEVGLFFLT